MRQRTYECEICGDIVEADAMCGRCDCCDVCCDCTDQELFDADELGLDPEEDDELLYGRRGLAQLFYDELRELHRILPIPGDPNA